MQLGDNVESEEMRIRLRAELGIDVSATVCETWLRRDWSSSGKLLSIQEIEDQLGDRLRLPQYRHSVEFETVTELLETLAEGQPPACTEAALLRQWYTKFHPDSGPIRIADAATLEGAHGGRTSLEVWGHEVSGSEHGAVPTTQAGIA